MGLDSGLNNGSSVVDTSTKVYGTDNLFIVDASIFPGMASTNPSALIVAAAEHAAALILAADNSNAGTSSAIHTISASSSGVQSLSDGSTATSSASLRSAPSSVGSVESTPTSSIPRQTPTMSSDASESSGIGSSRSHNSPSQSAFPSSGSTPVPQVRFSLLRANFDDSILALTTLCSINNAVGSGTLEAQLVPMALSAKS